MELKQTYEPMYMDYEEKEFLSYDMVSCFQKEELSGEEMTIFHLLENDLSVPKRCTDLDVIVERANLQKSVEEVADLVRKVANTQVTVDFRRISPEGTIMVMNLFPIYEEISYDPDTNEKSYHYISAGYSAHYLAREVMEQLSDGKTFRDSISDLLIFKRISDDEIVDIEF